MCDHGLTTMVEVMVPADLSAEGRAMLKAKPVDACIASLVAALQRGGIDMRGSCCGHGERAGEILLQDGR